MSQIGSNILITACQRGGVLSKLISPRPGQPRVVSGDNSALTQKKNHICFENTQRRSPTIHIWCWIYYYFKPKKRVKITVIRIDVLMCLFQLWSYITSSDPAGRITGFPIVENRKWSSRITGFPTVNRSDPAGRITGFSTVEKWEWSQDHWFYHCCE